MEVKAVQRFKNITLEEKTYSVKLLKRCTLLPSWGAATISTKSSSTPHMCRTLKRLTIAHETAMAVPDHRDHSQPSRSRSRTDAETHATRTSSRSLHGSWPMILLTGVSPTSRSKSNQLAGSMLTSASTG